MIINYLEVQAIYTRRHKLEQAMKLDEWAWNEFERNRGKANEVSGTR